MRALPPLTLTLSRYPVWNAAVGAVGLLAIGSLAGWGFTWADALGPAPALGLAALAAAVAWLAIGLWRRGATQLGWDGSQWLLGEGSAATACDCAVALDLGGWMLLRCRTSRVDWLPVQRGMTGCDWHALRCTVYSPRPAPVRSDGPDRPA